MSDRKAELQSEAFQLQARYGFLALQSEAIEKERADVKARLLAGEQEYNRLVEAEKKVAEAPAGE